MKILKMCVIRKYRNVHYYCMFDEIPEITYEKFGAHYIGSATDSDGDVVFSHFLRRGYSGAFAGRELSLTMKDGSVQKIKDYWWDNGCYPEHGEFVDIGAGTLGDLQKCYVYRSLNINKTAFQKMLDDYYSREKEYEYYEIEAWVKTQYTWYPVMVDGKVFEPLMVNEKGHFAEKYTKKIVYPRENRYRRFKKANRSFTLHLFKYQYSDGKRLVKVERSLEKIYRDSLPLMEDELVAIIEGVR